MRQNNQKNSYQWKSKHLSSN